MSATSGARLLPFVLLIALAGAIAYFALSEGSTTQPDGSENAAVEAPEKPQPVGADLDAAPKADRVAVPDNEIEVRETAPPALQAYPGDRPLGQLRVIVLDADKQPVAGARIALKSEIGPYPPGLAIADDRRRDVQDKSDEEGNCRFEGLPVGAYDVVAESEDGRRKRNRAAVTEDEDNSVVLVLEEPAIENDFVVKVIDPDKQPVAGAEVTVVGGLLRVGVLGENGLDPLRGTSDEQGYVRFADKPMSGAVVSATAPDGRRGLTATWRRDGVARAMRAGGLTVVVDAAGVLEGSVLGPRIEDGSRLIVRANALNNSSPYYTTYGLPFETRAEDGRYRFEALPAGTYNLTIESSDGYRLQLPQMTFGSPLANSVDPLTAEVRAGETTVLDLPLILGGTLTGVVRREGGVPVAGAEVWTTYAPRTSNFPDGFTLHGVNVWRLDSETATDGVHPETHPRTRTDAQGRYRLTGLHPGLHRVEVFARGLSCDRREGIEIADGGETQLEHELEASGVLQGRASLTYLGVTRVGEAQPEMIAILGSKGLFTFPGLKPGKYELASFHSDQSQGSVPLTVAEVFAGRTTWVDLERVQLPVEIGGRVLDAFGPVEGARVRLGAKWTRTDESGLFGVGVAFPWTYQVSLAVYHEELTTDFQYPGMEQGDTRWFRDIVLGRESLQLQCRDVTGLPVAAKLDIGAQDLAPVEGQSPRRCYANELPIDESGERTIERLYAGTYYLTVRFPSGAEVTQQVEVPHLGPVVIQEFQAGVLEVTVKDTDGTPKANWYVHSSTWLGEGPPPENALDYGNDGHWASAKTDAEGKAVLRGVRTGHVVISTRPSGFWLGDREPAVERTHLGAGERRQLELVVTVGE